METTDPQIDEIEKKVEQIYSMDSKELTRQINETQKFALKEYSREKFTENMDNFLSKVVGI